VISLPLSEVFLAEAKFSLDQNNNLERIDGPNYRNKKGVHEKHDTLLFNDTVVMFIEVVVGDGFHEQSHQGCSEKHTHCIFESEWELIIVWGCMFFNVGEMM